jgi:uncharacterized membrane protein
LKIKPSHEGKLDVAIWVCLYGGLLSVAAAFAISDVQQEASWWLGGAGSLVTAVGVILIYIRSKTQ